MLPFLICFISCSWTYCPYLIGRDRSLFTAKGMLFNPGILATFGGLLLSLLPVSLPLPIVKLLETVGMMTIPLSMLMIGGLLANLKWKALCTYMQDKNIWVACLAKLVWIPLLLFPALLLPIPFTLLAVAILISASPSAPTTSLFAHKYKGEVYFASVGVFLSTLFAFLTIPLIYWLLLWLRDQI